MIHDWFKVNMLIGIINWDELSDKSYEKSKHFVRLYQGSACLKMTSNYRNKSYSLKQI